MAFALIAESGIIQSANFSRPPETHKSPTISTNRYVLDRGVAYVVPHDGFSAVAPMLYRIF